VLRYTARRNQTVGAILTPEQGWTLAQAWFTDARLPDWQRPPLRVLIDCAAGLGLSGRFWQE
jgi:nitrous oxide reductase accessory protein NosL